MVTMADEILRYRAELSDLFSDRWSDELFIIWQNEAVIEAFNLRPELFQSIVISKLLPGGLQKPCNCEKFYGVSAITDAAGNVICYPRSVNATSMGFFCSPCAGGSSSGSVTETGGCPSISVNPDVPGVFEVIPPVGPLADVYARLICSNAPVPVCDPNGELCLHSTIYPAIRAYVKAMAYATEKESVNSREWFNTWMSMFYRVMNIHKTIDDEIYNKAVNRNATAPTQ